MHKEMIHNMLNFVSTEETNHIRGLYILTQGQWK